MPTFHRYNRSARHTARVAPEPVPQLSLREEVAIYKAKLRAIKEARLAQAPPPPPKPKPANHTKPKKNGNRPCLKAIKEYFKALRDDFTSGFRKHIYMCMGFMCCLTSEVRAFVDDEFPTTQVPVV